MRQGILRNRNSCIKHRYSYNPVFIRKRDPYLLSFIQMIQGICKVIHKYFFYFKFITPDKDLFFLNEGNLCLTLLDQNRCRLEIIPYQFYNIKSLHRYHIVSKFKLIKSQKLLHHHIHLFRFIHDNITIKITAFRIFINILLQPLSISKDQRNRCLKFMGNIGQKLLSHFINLLFFCDILLQFIICGLQLRYRFFQPVRHLIHVIAQQSNLIFVFSGIFCIKIQIGHPFGNRSKLQDRIRNFSADPPDSESAEHD